MAETLKADLLVVDKVTVDLLQKYDLVGFGSGIYFQKHHRTLLELVKNLPNDMKQRAFVFSTSGMGTVKYNHPLEVRLREKGFELTSSFACKGFDTWGIMKLFGGLGKGRPNQQDLQQAKTFAENLIK